MRPFAKLRGYMVANGDDFPTVSNVLLISQTHLSHKMNAHTSWTLDEVYTLADRYGIPYADICKVFPKDGRNE